MHEIGRAAMFPDDFTFPVINDVLNPTLLPPLWRISSTNHDAQNGRRRKMFPAQVMNNVDPPDEAEGAQEKMDVLWEDFNEELQLHTDADSDSDSDSRREECESPEGVKLIPAKRKRLESLVMMVKKIFLQDNNGSRSGSN